MRGGSRTGAGRKPKADELKLIENLTPLHKQALESLKIGLEAILSVLLWMSKTDVAY
jgi:hypothetical protein